MRLPDELVNDLMGEVADLLRALDEYPVSPVPIHRDSALVRAIRRYHTALEGYMIDRRAPK